MSCYYYSTILEHSDICNNPAHKLLDNYSEILSILNSDKKDIMLFFYFNKSNLNNILYNSDEIMNIEIIKVKSRKSSITNILKKRTRQLYLNNH